MACTRRNLGVGMQVGSLVTYKMDHDGGTPAWIGIITTISDCGRMAWVHWSDFNRWAYRVPVTELMEVK